MRKHHAKPTNHQDFEILCVKILRAHWKSDQIDLYASSGYSQHGVDIIDTSGCDPLRAAQCKLHDENKQLTPGEIEQEVKKAREFNPPLGLYVIMTTSKSNPEAQDYVLKVNQLHREQHLFQVQLMWWNRIEELLDQYSDVCDEYEGGFSAAAVARIEAYVANIEVGFAARTADEKDDQIHTEIDEVRDYVNRHEYQLAKLLLHRIQSHRGAELSPRHKFRIFTNLAAVAIGEDDWKKAAEFYLEAKRQQPDDEMALINEALSYQIRGNHSHAFELAFAIKDRYPTAERLYAIVVRNAPDHMTFDEVKMLVPASMATKGEAAIALSERALNAEQFTEAETFARSATESNPQWSSSWIMLAGVIIEDEIHRSWRKYGFGTLICETIRLGEAESAFTKALSCAQAEKSKMRVVAALLNRSRARGLLHQEALMYEDVDEAYRIAPDDPNVLVAYARSLRLKGNVDGAIETLCRVPVDTIIPDGHMILAMLLRERGRVGDCREAGIILAKLARTPQQMREDLREHVIEMALEVYRKDGQPEIGKSLLSEIPKGAVSSVAMATLQAMDYHLQSQLMEAASCADDALNNVSNDTSPHDLRRLAALLSELGRHRDALELWQRVAVPSLLSDDTRQLLQCANRLGRHDIMLSIFSSLRSAGSSIDTQLQDIEFSLLSRYDTVSAIEMLKQEIDKNPVDRKLKLRLSVLGLALDRSDLIDPDPSSVPSTDDVSPEDGIRAVQVLREIGHPNEAVQYAYELVRLRFNDVDAHRALMAAFVPLAPDPDIQKPDTAQVGTAVCYQEYGVHVLSWVIIEDSKDPDVKLNELPPESFLCKQILGKRIGDSFILAEGIQDRVAEIKDILSKYVYRYQDCIMQWQIRFPNYHDIQMARCFSNIGESGKEELDISAITKAADNRYKSAQTLYQMYQDQPVTIHLAGEWFSSNAFKAMIGLASEPNVFVKCCIGSVDERTEAAKMLRSSNRIVLDMTAVSTLFLLERLDLFENWPIEIVVSQGTVNELRQMIANDSRHSTGEGGVLGKNEIGYSFIHRDPKQTNSYIDLVRELVDILERKCKVEACRSLAAVDPKKRDIMVKSFGYYGAESIVLASVPGTILWTDDHVQAIYARSEHGVSRVWTQLVIGAKTEMGAIDFDTYFEASAKLMGFGYFFTSANPQILQHAAILSNWQLDHWPFAQALSIIEHNSIDISTAAQLIAGFLPLLYRESILVETKSAITFRILDHLSKKNNGYKAIVELRKALDRILGLNVIGFNDAIKAIDAWLDASRQRPLL